MGRGLWVPQWMELYYRHDRSRQPLIQTERINSGTLEYQFTVPNASYSVNLIFGEIAGAQLHQRRFNIVIHGQTCAADIDVFGLSSLHAN